VLLWLTLVTVWRLVPWRLLLLGGVDRNRFDCRYCYGLVVIVDGVRYVWTCRYLLRSVDCCYTVYILMVPDVVDLVVGDIDPIDCCCCCCWLFVDGIVVVIVVVLLLMIVGGRCLLLLLNVVSCWTWLGYWTHAGLTHLLLTFDLIYCCCWLWFLVDSWLLLLVVGCVVTVGMIPVIVVVVVTRVVICCWWLLLTVVVVVLLLFVVTVVDLIVDVGPLWLIGIVDRWRYC